MAIVSVTRFRLNSGAVRGNTLFFWHTLRSIRQAGRSAGFVRGQTYADANRTYWTITMWESIEAVRAYMKSGAHLKAMRAMPRMMRWCDEAQTGHFEHHGEDVPNLVVCHEQLMQQAHFLRLKYPSADHTAGRIAEPQIVDRSFPIRRRPPRRGFMRAARSAMQG